MTYDETIRIGREDFFRAEPVLVERVKCAIDEIRKNPCFIDKGLVYDPKYSSRHFEKSRSGSGSGHSGRAGHPRDGGGNRKVYQRDVLRRPTVINSGISKDRRCINENINKVTASNYGTVSKRIKLILDDENLRYGVGEMLDKAYEQFVRCDLYVDLILDICNSLSPGQKGVVQAFLKERLSDSLDETCTFPHVDPGKDYDGFCKIVKKKTRAVGRCHVFSKMLKKVQGFFGYSPEQYYDHHETLVLKYVNEDLSVDIDIAASIETLLDCLDVIIKHYKMMRTKFQKTLTGLSVDEFPSNRCRFKVMDILGK